MSNEKRNETRYEQMVQEYEKQHVDMIYHIKVLRDRNEKLQARLDQAMAEIAKRDIYMVVA